MSVRVKICGVARREDAVTAYDLAVDYLGVVLTPGFARSVAPDDAARMLEGTSAGRVAVLVDETADDAEARARTIDASIIQLHGSEEPAVLAELRSRGEWRLWKAVRARAAGDVTRAVERYSGTAHGILVEGWKQGVVGGGGAALAADPGEVRAAIPPDLDFILAGALAPDTVADAVALFGPDVVDVSSGVEAELREKDPDLVRRFVAAVSRRRPLAANPRRGSSA